MAKQKTTMIEIENMEVTDWADVSNIYNEGLLTQNATFEKECPEWKIWDKNHRADCRIVAKIDGRIVGWAALSDVSNRCIYSGVCEVSIYVSNDFQGKGIGNELFDRLIIESENQNVWTLQAGIFPENTSSIGLHEKKGFRQIGVREKIGKMNDTWRNVILFERRSKKIGID